jgi:hypothetical protein
MCYSVIEELLTLLHTVWFDSDALLKNSKGNCFCGKFEVLYIPSSLFSLNQKISAKFNPSELN